VQQIVVGVFSEEHAELLPVRVVDRRRDDLTAELLAAPDSPQLGVVAPDEAGFVEEYAVNRARFGPREDQLRKSVPPVTVQDRRRSAYANLMSCLDLVGCVTVASTTLAGGRQAAA